MIFESAKFRNYTCFKNEWSGFEVIKPVNVIIGRNNTGKSHLLDFVEYLCDSKPSRQKWPLLGKGVLDEESLRGVFKEGYSGGDLSGDHWDYHGRGYIDSGLTWESDKSGNVTKATAQFCRISGRDNDEAFRQQYLMQIAHKARHRFYNFFFRRLFADRDIQPEVAHADLKLSFGGQGATNIIRSCILVARMPRELIQQELLHGLNEIFGADGLFTEIFIRQPGMDGPPKPQHHCCLRQ